MFLDVLKSVHLPLDSSLRYDHHCHLRQCDVAGHHSFEVSFFLSNIHRIILLAIFKFSRKLRDKLIYLLFCEFCVMNMMEILFVMIFSVVGISKGFWDLGDTLCRLNTFAQEVRFRFLHLLIKQIFNHFITVSLPEDILLAHSDGDRTCHRVFATTSDHAATSERPGAGVHLRAGPLCHSHTVFAVSNRILSLPLPVLCWTVSVILLPRNLCALCILKKTEILVDPQWPTQS